MFVSVMEEDYLDPQDVERAKAFWAEEDVDQVFNGVYEYLDHLKRVLKKHTATDKEYVQSLQLLQSLTCPPASQDASVVQVVIGSGELLQPDSAPSPVPASNGASRSSPAPPAGREELLPPLSISPLQYELHACCQSCLPGLPSMLHSTPAFWGQNPLKVPLLCGFKRLNAAPLTSPSGDAVEEDGDGVEDGDVVYKAPCGRSLRNHDDVMRFLLATESYDALQVDFFTFNPDVRLDPPTPAGPQRPEMDLSRGVEPTPVQLCVGDSGARPAEFRYRKDRWPHGCFLSRGPVLFDTCCDCTDGCTDPERCACAAMTRGGRRYRHQRLSEPVPSGVFECGPWCGCVRARCQNRVVQRGIKVRLQVFQTDGRGWGVRCRDDLDGGTFVCVYAGVMLRRVQTVAEATPPKLPRADLPSDDEVEVVTEWLAPPVLEARSGADTASNPLHVPVIQRPADGDANAATPQDRDTSVLVSGPEAPPPSGEESCDGPPALEKVVPMTTDFPVNGTAAKSLKRAAKAEDVYFLDASKEGNVSRFINHSCEPNLFVQDVFTDTHDLGFPVTAFFTSRAVAAGSELTWNYSAAARSRAAVACLCSSDGCRGEFIVEEKLCEECEDEGHDAETP